MNEKTVLAGTKLQQWACCFTGGKTHYFACFLSFYHQHRGMLWSSRSYCHSAHLSLYEVLVSYYIIILFTLRLSIHISLLPVLIFVQHQVQVFLYNCYWLTENNCFDNMTYMSMNLVPFIAKHVPPKWLWAPSPEYSLLNFLYWMYSCCVLLWHSLFDLPWG